MSTPIWPTILPQEPFAEDGATYTPMDNVIVSSPDVGPGKRRRRYTGKNDKFNFTMILNPAQLAAFEVFYETTLAGVKKFQWIDHRTGLTANYRFIKKPTNTYYGSDVNGTWWILPTELELVP